MKLNIENKKQFATILLAVGLGLVAAFLMSYHVETSINRQTEALKQNYDKQSAQMAAALQQEVARALKLQQADFEKRLKQMAQAQQAQLKKELASIPKNDASAQAAAAQVIDSTIFSKTTPVGKRAVTILIDSLSAVGGLIKPGDTVDILADVTIPEKRDINGIVESESKDITSVMFQNIQVLAVGANFKQTGSEIMYQSQQKTRSLNVTLAVDPEEAGLLVFAQKFGKLQMALRPPTERDTKNLQVAAWDSLSDYVLDKQGTELEIPKRKATSSSFSNDGGDTIESEASPFIEIFRGGEEL